MADQEIVFRFIADDTELRAALAALEGEFGAVEDAAGDAGEEMGGGLTKGAAGGAAAMTALAGSAKKGGSATRGLATAVSAVSPAAGKAIRGINGLKTAAMGLGVAAGPIGAVIAALAAGAAAYAYLNREIEKANDLIKEQQALATGMADATSALDRTIQKVSDEYGVYAGAISTADLKIRDFNRSLDSQTTAVIAQIRASDISTAAQERNIAALQERIALAKDLNAEIIREEEAARNAAAAAAANAAAVQGEAAAERELAAAVRESAAAELERERAAEEARRKRIAAVNDALDREFERQDAKAAKDDEDAEKAASRAATVQQTIEDSAVSVAGSISAAAADAAARQAAEGKKSATIMFGISKTAALAQVGFNAAVAISRQFAELPLPAAIASSAAITASAIAPALAAINSQAPPVAHTGTPAGGGMAPDERMSYGRRVLNTELSTPGAVANSTATQLIDDANNGKLSGSNQRITAVIGRSHLDDELGRSGRSGTTRYARNLRNNPHPRQNRGY